MLNWLTENKWNYTESNDDLFVSRSAFEASAATLTETITQLIRALEFNSVELSTVAYTSVISFEESRRSHLATSEIKVRERKKGKEKGRSSVKFSLRFAAIESRFDKMMHERRSSGNQYGDISPTGTIEAQKQ